MTADLSESRNVISTPPTRLGRYLTFYVFERLEDEHALTIRFIGCSARVRLQERNNAANKSVRYANYMYPLHAPDDLPTLFAGWDKVSKATLKLPCGREFKIDSDFPALIQPAPYIVKGKYKYLYNY